MVARLNGDSIEWLIERRSRRPRNAAREFPLAATHSMVPADTNRFEMRSIAAAQKLLKCLVLRFGATVRA